jgi:hypothetical protein
LVITEAASFMFAQEVEVDRVSLARQPGPTVAGPLTSILAVQVKGEHAWPLQRRTSSG